MTTTRRDHLGTGPIVAGQTELEHQLSALREEIEHELGADVAEEITIRIEAELERHGL